MRRTALFLALFLCLPLCAHADDASKRAKVRELFELLHTDRLSKTILDNIMKQASAMPKQIYGGDVPADAQPKVDAFQKQVFDLVDSQVGWKAIEPAYIDLYAQTYTEQELDAILAFYKSPAGTSMLAKAPDLNAKGLQLVQTKMQSIQPQLRQLTDDFVKQVRSSAPAPAATPSTTPAPAKTPSTPAPK